MMHHSGNHMIRWSPPLCEVNSSVAYTNGDKNGFNQGKIANTTVSWTIFRPQPPDMREPPMGRLLYILCSITDHDHLRMKVW